MWISLPPDIFFRAEDICELYLEFDHTWLNIVRTQGRDIVLTTNKNLSPSDMPGNPIIVFTDTKLEVWEAFLKLDDIFRIYDDGIELLKDKTMYKATGFIDNPPPPLDKTD